MGVRHPGETGGDRRQCGLLRELPLSAACAVLGLERGSYYRFLAGPASKKAATRQGRDEEAALLAALEQVVVEFPGYGYLRMTHQLRREGFRVNPRRVYRLRGEAGWLHRRKRGRVRTTDSEHGYAIYPNLLSDRGWREWTGPNQAWGVEVDLEEYRSFREAKQWIGRFIEEAYNRKRLHSALGYRPPSEFAEIFAAGILH